MNDRVEAVRAFNRFYTGVIGVLRDGLLDTPYSLAEARILYELAQADATEVADLRSRLGLDAGYLSRLLARFDERGLVTRERSPDDGRRQVARLTGAGRDAFAQLDQRSAEENAALLAPLADSEQRRLVAAMRAIRGLLEPGPPPPAYVLRAPRAGDHGWVVHRHGVVYADEYGWDQAFEALVARIVADYLAGHDPRREACWIAEVDGEPAGSVYCMRKDDETAQLRLLLVEPRARGLGIGGRLVDECVRFAARAGYRRLVLWTNDCLVDARRVYERAGFTLTDSEPHRSFGADLVGQHWRLDLGDHE